MNDPAALNGFRRIPLAHIDSVVAAQLGPARVRGNAQPALFSRQVAMYLAKHIGGWSTTQIGRFYNGRDHSTVCHAVRKVQSLRATDARISALIDVLAAELMESSTGVGASLLPQNPPRYLETCEK